MRLKFRNLLCMKMFQCNLFGTCREEEINGQRFICITKEWEINFIIINDPVLLINFNYLSIFI